MLQDIASFRTELRQWLSASFPREDGLPRTGADRDPVRHRYLQRLLFEGGYAGLTYPLAYGGRGLTPEFQDAFNEEAAGYELPTLFNVTLGILGPTILDFGTEEQKLRHIPAILRGDELWVQLLSEPASGSDLAGCITRASRDGDQWILNGSKIWSTGAHFSDFALCLARSNWSVPKHRGLTMCIIKLSQPGIDIEPIMQANGEAEFCQEFLTDVAIDAADILGEENAGWQVASRLLTHERNLAGAASPFTYGFVAEGTPVAPTAEELVELARGCGNADDPPRAGARGRGARARLDSGQPRRTYQHRHRDGRARSPPSGRCSACSRSPRWCNARTPARISPALSSRCGRRRRPGGWATSSSCAKRRRWPAAASRCSATSFRNGCSVSPVSSPPTSVSPSTRCPTTLRAPGGEKHVRFDATEEQQQLQAITRRFLEDTAPLTTVRLWGEKNPAGFDRDWWRRAADLGWTSLLVPEDQGGSAGASKSASGAGVAGLTELAIVAEERGRLVSPGPLLPVSVAAWTLAVAGADTDAKAQSRATLEAALSGTAVCTWVVGESEQSWLTPAPPVTAVSLGSSLELTGTARSIESGADSDSFVVAVGIGDVVLHVLVPAEIAGLHKSAPAASIWFAATPT